MSIGFKNLRLARPVQFISVSSSMGTHDHMPLAVSPHRCDVRTFPLLEAPMRSRTQCHENCRNSGNCRNTTILMLSRWCQRRGAWCNLRWTESVARNKPKSEITVNAMTWYFSLTLIHDLLQGHVRSRWPLLPTITSSRLQHRYIPVARVLYWLSI